MPDALIYSDRTKRTPIQHKKADVPEFSAKERELIRELLMALANVMHKRLMPMDAR